MTCDRKEKIVWECANGGQLWTTSAAAGYGSGNIPSSFCTAGFASLNTAFIVGMLADLMFQVCWIVINVVRTRVSELFWQVYMLFITWRYSSRLENYTSLKYGTD